MRYVPYYGDWTPAEIEAGHTLPMSCRYLPTAKATAEFQKLVTEVREYTAKYSFRIIRRG